MAVIRPIRSKPRTILAIAAVAAISCARIAIASDDGTWAPIGPPPARQEHVAIYDPVADRMILHGGTVNDLWSMSLADGAWTRIFFRGEAPSQRYGHSAIHDPVRRRMLVFGGHQEARHWNDVWALSLDGEPVWTRLEVEGVPPLARYDHVAVYDPARDAMIVIGGYHWAPIADAWMLTLSGTPTWTRLEPAGADSMARYRHAAVFDAAHDRVVVFGGSDGQRSHDTWALNLGAAPAWSRLETSGAAPTARIRHAAALDASGDRMLVFAGTDGTRRNDVWALSLDDLAWTPLEPGGARPTRRNESSAVFDSGRERLVVFGGYEEDERVLGDAWTLSTHAPVAWTRLTASIGVPPSHMGFQASVYDSRRQRLIQCGGWYSLAGQDLYSLDLGPEPRWTLLAPRGAGPSRRLLTAGLYDPVRDRVIVIGGLGQSRNGDYETLDDVWALSLSGAPTWTQILPLGTPGARRVGGVAVYDPVGDRAIVVGGSTALPWCDAWELSLGDSPAMSPLATEGGPPVSRYRHAAAYDPLRRQVVLFAGQRDTVGNDASPVDTWTLSLDGTPTWTEIGTGARLPWAGASQATILDPLRDRLVAHLDYGHGVWALDLSDPVDWKPLHPEGPPPRFQFTAVYDPVADRMIQTGGTVETPSALVFGDPVRPMVHGPAEAPWHGGSSLDLSYRLFNPLPETRAISWRLSADPPRAGFPMRGSLLVAGNQDAPLAITAPIGTSAEDARVDLELSASFAGAEGNDARHDLSIRVPAATAFALHGVRPNPASGAAAAFVTLPAAGPLTLALHDVAGRRAAPRRVLELAAGHHLLPLEFHRGAEPGVYFLRATFGTESRHVRVVLR